METGHGRKKLLGALPDIGISLFFATAALLAVGGDRVARFVCSQLTIWFVYEYYGAFFLLLWVGLNEQRQPSRRMDLFRTLSAAVAYLGCALLMHLGFGVSRSAVTISAVGGVWWLLSPLVRQATPTALQIGRETAIGIVALLASFFLVTFFASIAEQTLERPFRRTTFEAITITAIGAVYYLLRWQLVSRCAPRTAT